MQERSETLLLLVQHFALLSLMAVGGANVLLPEMHQFAVERHHWMTHREFGELFSVARVRIDREQRPVNFGMQCFDSPVEDLGEARNLGNRTGRNARLPKDGKRTAG